MNNDVQENEIKLSEQSIQLGNILLDTINNGMMGDRIVLTLH